MRVLIVEDEADLAEVVVVAVEPDLCEVGETRVLGDLARRKMTVVIENRLRLGEFMVKSPGRVATK